MNPSYLNYFLDATLVLAAIWMVLSVRGVGGIVGRTVLFIVIGALITGIAHPLATVSTGMFGTFDGAVHRVIVLIGFVFLVIGFRQLQAMKR
jgi:hypothetical protein